MLLIASLPMSFNSPAGTFVAIGAVDVAELDRGRP
jgi:hypothetical protein